jgi:recombinational DNA repair protein (RecF pathway)
MVYLKINGLILVKEKVKENDAFLFILTKNNGLLKCYSKGSLKSQSKNLTLFEPGNFCRFFIITNLEKFQAISALPLKIPTQVFHRQPYIFLWTLKLIKNLKLIETPKFSWFVLTHLESYLKQNAQNFPYWFLFHLLRELGYEINLENCHHCQRKLKNFAYFDCQRFIYCFYCRKDSYLKVTELKEAKKIKNLAKVPLKIPEFLKMMIKKQYAII